MGRRKKPVYEQPYYSPYYYQLTGFQKSPGIDITPLAAGIEKKTETEKGEAIANLRNAIMSAIGSLTYNPYERMVSESLTAKAERQVSPFKGTETIAPTLKTAGAYVALPPPAAPAKAQYEAYLPTYEKTFQSAKEFLESTRQNLSTMGFNTEEIRGMMSPYLSAIQEGLTSSLGMGGTIKPEYQEFVTEWGLV
jgi:hypothetical protein